MTNPQGQVAGDGYKYESVIRNIGVAIETGALLPGDRLPSLRAMSSKSRVSISTVMKAYLELESEGQIEARPQSGYYVRHRFRDIPAPRISNPELQPMRVDSFNFHFDVLNAMADTSIVPLGAATPAPELLPVAELTRIARQIANSHENAYGYEEVSGNKKLRAQIAFHMLEAGISAHMDEIIITHGGTEALYLALSTLAGPGDTVAVESPCYFGYLQILEDLGIYALEIPTDPETGVDIEKLSQALDSHPVKACILQPNFNNPFGCLTPDDKKRALAKLFAARNVPLIEDDIVGDLPFSGVRPRAINSFADGENSIFISSFSKMLAPGFRIGWIWTRNHRPALLRRKMAVSMNSNRPAQLTLAEYLAAGRYGKHLKSYAQKCKKQVGLVSAAVGRAFPENTRLTRPKGGFLLWAVLPEEIDTDILYDKALAEGIGIAPGSIFTSQKRYRNCLRISCAHPYSERIESALKRLGELAAEST